MRERVTRTDPPSRALRPAASPDERTLKEFYEKSWAVVIGIDRYASDAIRPLACAVADAREFARLLIEHLGFPRDQVFVLLEPSPPDAHSFDLVAGGATKSNIEELLFTRIPELVGPDDRVIVFFAGHGERRRLPGAARETGYLTPSDARVDAWHTYLDLDQIIRAGNLCAAKHIFYLLDACYSGLATARGDERPSRYEQDMLTNRARQVLTAGTARQAVADRGAGIHSHFTEYVLRGLRGEADMTNDGVITASELMVFVKNEVARQFGSAQTPDFGPLPGHESGGDFVFKLPGFSAREHFALGLHLMDAGRRSSDAKRFAAAASQFTAAVNVQGKAWPEASRWLGVALMGAGQVEEAIRVLDRAHANGDEEAALHLGMAYARERKYGPAAEALSRFGERCPDHADASWAREYAASLRRSGGGRRHALIIAKLDGEGDLLRQFFVQDLLLTAGDITFVPLEQTTTTIIIEEFRKLAQRTIEADTAIMYIGTTGTQMVNTSPNYRTPDRLLGMLAAADLRKALLGEDELVDLVARVPARQKLLIVDAPHFSLPARVVREHGFDFISGCRRNELTWEKEGRPVFPPRLVQHWRELIHAQGAYHELVERIIASLRSDGFLGTPVYQPGRRKQVLGASRDTQDLWFGYHSRLYEITLYGAGQLRSEELSPVQRLLEGEHVPVPRAHVPFVRTLLDRDDSDAGERLLKIVQERQYDSPESIALTVSMTLNVYRHPDNTAYTSARGAMERLIDMIDGSDPRAAQARRLCDILQQLERGEPSVLLVGIAKYAGDSLPQVASAVADVEAVRGWLQEQFKDPPHRIAVLVNEQAHRDALLGAVRQLAADAVSRPAFLYFSGLGSVDVDGQPVLLPFDARQEGIEDVPLTLLHDITAAVSDNIVTLVDAGFSVESKDPRFAEPVSGGGIMFWGYEAPDRAVTDSLRIGGFAIYPGSLRRLRAKADKRPPRASFTRKVIRVLRPLMARPLLRDRLEKIDVTVLANRWGGSLFDNQRVIREAASLLDQIDHSGFQEARGLLKTLLDSRRDRDPAAWLELGVLSFLVGRFQDAIDALQRALGSVDGVAGQSVGPGSSHHSQAHFYLGRTYLAMEEWARAVDEFDRAFDHVRPDERAQYYRGQALRGLIEGDLARRLDGDWRSYLDAGAPLGDEQEVSAYLNREVRALLSPRHATKRDGRSRVKS